MNTTTNMRVSEAMVERAWCAYDHAVDSCDAPELSEKLRVAMRAALEAALSAPEPAAQGEDESRQLREILAIYVAGPMLYTDDGELSDATREPCIDFLRDSADTIARKLADRSRTAPPAQPAERVPDGMVLVPIPPANCRERFLREGKPYPRSGCAVCGKWAPKWRDCDVLLQAAAISTSPAPSEGGKGVGG